MFLDKTVCTQYLVEPSFGKLLDQCSVAWSPTTCGLLTEAALHQQQPSASLHCWLTCLSFFFWHALFQRAVLGHLYLIVEVKQVSWSIRHSVLLIKTVLVNWNLCISNHPIYSGTLISKSVAKISSIQKSEIWRLNNSQFYSLAI